jgi:hypothetical protein
MSVFEDDIRDAENSLKKEKKKGFFSSLLTLGLINNSKKIKSASEYLKKCQEDADKYDNLKLEAADLGEQLKEVVKLKGVRVSKMVFSDIRVLNGADYPLDWDNLRDMILTRDNYECTEEDGYCNGPLQIHHIVPLSKGGPNDPDNLTTLCYYHHSLKHPHMQRH